MSRAANGNGFVHTVVGFAVAFLFIALLRGLAPEPELFARKVLLDLGLTQSPCRALADRVTAFEPPPIDAVLDEPREIVGGPDIAIFSDAQWGRARRLIDARRLEAYATWLQMHKGGRAGAPWTLVDRTRAALSAGQLPDDLYSKGC